MVVEHGVGQFHGQLSALRHRIARVDRQIQDDVLELVDVHKRVPQTAGHHRFHLNGLAQGAPKQVVHAANRGCEVDHNRLQRLLAAEGEQLRGELRTAFHGIDRLLQPLACPAVTGMTPVQQFEVAAQDLQDVVEVVRHAACQLADRLHLLRLEQRLSCILKKPVRFHPLGDVAGDLGKSRQRAIVFPDRVDHNVRPKTRAIFPDPPAFRFKTAVPGGSIQPTLWQPGRSVFRHVKARKMRADDFFCRVALDAAGAGVPVGDEALRREHEDRVVGDAVNQHAEAPLAFEHGVVRGLFIGHVAHDFHETGKLPIFVMQCVNDDAGPKRRAVLADPPPFGVVTACASSDPEAASRHPFLPVVVGIENVQRLADDLLRLVSVDGLGAWIPAQNPAVRRNRKN